MCVRALFRRRRSSFWQHSTFSLHDLVFWLCSPSRRSIQYTTQRSTPRCRQAKSMRMFRCCSPSSSQFCAQHAQHEHPQKHLEDVVFPSVPKMWIAKCCHFCHHSLKKKCEKSSFPRNSWLSGPRGTESYWAIESLFG